MSPSFPSRRLLAAACNGRLYAVATNSATDDLVQFFDDLVRAETRLYNALSETLRHEHGLVTTQYEFLRYFRDHPDSRIGDAAKYFAAGIGAISKGVDRLEGSGWVQRRPNPADGRSSLVRLSAEGATLVAAAEDTFRRRLAELVAPGPDGRSMHEMGALRAQLEAGGIGVPAG